MILFKKDWADYPSAIADNKTTNTHFLKSAALYKVMGIENHLFMLALYQPKLQGVDPYSPDLTELQKKMIAVEVAYNPWYFFREIFRVPAGAIPSPFRTNRGSLSLLWSYFTSVDFSLLMQRQEGKSVTADGIKLYILFWGVKNEEIFLFTKNSKLRARNIRRLKDMIDLLPAWLNPTIPADADNTEVVTCVTRNNIIRCDVAQPQLALADNVGRGDTFSTTHTDEGPAIINIQHSLPVLLSATTSGRDNSKAANTYYGNIFTNTAGKLDTPNGKYMHDFIDNGMYWNEILLDSIDRGELIDRVKKGCKGDRILINGNFNHRQLGITDEQQSEKIALSGGTKEKIDRDYYGKWSHGTESSPLTAQLNNIITQSIVDPEYTHVTVDNYVINWYIPESTIKEEMGKTYHVLTLDSGESVGKDANALIFTDIRDMSVVATSRVTESSIIVYATFIGNLLLQYPKTLLVIENKSTGQAILDVVTPMLTNAGIDPFRRIYNTVVDLYKIKPEDFKRINKPLHQRNDDVLLSFRKYFGFKTNGSKRDFLYGRVLQETATSTGHLVRDNTLASEITGLISKNGRVDHRSKGHDDMVISWLLAHWFIRHSQNLEFYGIPSMDCLSMFSGTGAILSPEEEATHQEIIILKLEAEELKHKLMSGVNAVERLRYERLLRNTVETLSKKGDTTFSLDKLLSEIHTKGVSRRSLRSSITQFNSKQRLRR